MIEAKQLTKYFWKKKAVDSIDLSIEPGRIYGIIGENGSGKSTMLKLLAGLLHPSKGSISINGEPVTRRSASHIAYMTDSSRFFPYFKIRELVDFYDSQFEDFNRDKAWEVLEFLSLEPEQKLTHLSKGNLGRAKLAVTIAREAPFLLLDEPLSGLDPMVRESIVKGIIQFVDFDRQSLLITTHEIRDIEPLLDEVIIIQQGRKLAQQSVDDIRTHHQLDVEGWLKQSTR